MANYRDAIAAIAPWIEELDSVPIAADAVALERGESAVGKDLNEKRAVKETEAEVRSAGGGGGGAKPAASKSPKRTPKIDEALQRYRARSGRSIDLPPRRDLEYEKAPAREEPEPSRRSRRREPEPEPEPSNSDASGESYELTPTRAVSRRERAFTSPARSRKSVQVAVDDPAVVDHEMRLQRIERNILPVVSEARRRAAATVAEAEDAARRREAGTQATSSAADADAADADAANRASRKRKEEDEDSSRVARVSGELAALKKRVEEVAAAAAPETREEPAAAASAAAATGKREKRAASKVVPPPEPPKTRRGRSEAKAAAAGGGDRRRAGGADAGAGDAGRGTTKEAERRVVDVVGGHDRGGGRERRRGGVEFRVGPDRAVVHRARGGFKGEEGQEGEDETGSDRDDGGFLRRHRGGAAADAVAERPRDAARESGARRSEG